MNETKSRAIIREFVADYEQKKKTQTRWQAPIVGFASADDPLFDRLKEVVRPTHATPEDLLPGAKSVIAYFLPFSKSLHRANAATAGHCPRSWAVAYQETNQLIVDTNNQLGEELEGRGYRVALTPPTFNFDQESLLSDWSHRHIAYIAGIGTLGVHNLLITDKGCTGRIGSLVTDMDLDPTPRPSEEFCLHKAGMTCLKCVDKCRFGALFKDRFDRHACYRQCLVNDRLYEDLELVEVCGKCSSGVPCSETNPVKKAASRNTISSIC
jgi:epoxyqueuosine reductase QueG